MTAKTPLTILTGWLGAGKTTALNRMLAQPGGKRIAVLVNELGRIAIDTQLIVGAHGDVLELAGGCVCCKVDIKNDLWDGIADVVRRSAPDHVVLETTGIAEPAAILESLLAAGPHVLGRRDTRPADSDPEWERGWDDEPEIAAKRAADQARAREHVEPAGVVCVVDAESGASALVERESAAAQAMAADRVLLSKLDVAPLEAVRQTHARLDALAAEAERAAFPDGEERALSAWLLEPRPLRAWTTAKHAGEHAHAHHGQLVAIAISDDAPLVAERVLSVLDGLGAALVRAKGFVHLAGDDRRGFLERAGVRTTLGYRDAWGVAPRRTELVVIGDGLDEPALRRALWACRAGA